MTAAPGFEGPRHGEFADRWAPLDLATVPPPDARWDAIFDFALTWDGYAAHPNGQCSSIASQARNRWDRTGSVPRNLDTLRTCLFFEQRRWRGAHTPPDPESEQYIRALIEAIRFHAAYPDVARRRPPRRVACPGCGGKTGVPIIYGMPSGGDFARAERGDFALGGCVTTGDDPTHECSACGHRFGSVKPLPGRS